ncbi:major facilitator superfamily domain-containing protein [Ilyonectria robusta]|uniref:major facilitator superfamily domain-containing protein n=1 Tax=Ilyonectria robusta TaxID=1079257 RepID=UPI001E8D816B|nr:major facilitator superfamily domain-containing protein [Ilyonectria robusta]KAH8663333.1 major facilitator superfamily domain-containing protein [Ilyonectria robusta]
MSSAKDKMVPQDGGDVIRTPTDVAEGIVEKPHAAGADPALAFIGGEDIEFTPEEEKNVLRKIDWALMPLLCWIYALQFADKTSLNYASLMGIREDTKLDPDSQEYSWASSIFYAGYIMWEFPTTYLLRALPLGKYTSANIFLWGGVLTCHVFVFNYAGLLIVRFFLGALEATVTPAFVILVSAWYKQNEQAKRMGFWLSCNGLALLTLGPLAYGLSGVTSSKLETWKILYLVLGLPTIITGAYCWFYMPDNQTNAKFLTHREKVIAIERIRGNFQGIGSREWKWDQFFEAFRDPRTYLYIVFSLLMNIPNGGITSFGSLVINSFGFSKRLSLLLNMPTGIVDITCKLTFTFLSDKYLDRSLFAFIAILIPMIGGIMMIFIPLTAKAGLLVGYYFIGAAGSAWCLVMVMISNNTLGYTKKATVNGAQILAYAAGNWIGPQTFRANEAPEYYHGKMMVAVMYGCAALTLVALRVVNIMENKRRDKLAAEQPEEIVEGTEFLDLTDFQQPSFRYVL